MDSKYDTIDVLPEAGKLIIFDSRVVHQSLLYTGTKQRLAFIWQIFANTHARENKFEGRCAESWVEREQFGAGTTP